MTKVIIACGRRTGRETPPRPPSVGRGSVVGPWGKVDVAVAADAAVGDSRGLVFTDKVARRRREMTETLTAEEATGGTSGRQALTRLHRSHGYVPMENAAERR